MKPTRTSLRSAFSSITLTQVALVAATVLVAVAARLLPHPPNFTPLAAIGLFAGAISLRPAVAAATVLSAMLISDLFLGFHSLMPVVYGCLLVNLVIGARFVRGRQGLDFGAGSCTRIVGGSLMGSVLFFLVTNFAHFLAFYPLSGSGLFACYSAAIPFFQFTLTGDLVYSGVLFGTFALVSMRSETRSPARLQLVPAE